ncbi:putative uncharacterized protein DDB_G0271982 isoform X2 [Aplysia californica]|nr:putative uncharacterized protein DDB_G0271982 isoform X2 [Aplysia californica]XP_035828963.1 putative uncharacterized protein DDB_G0271982 isoform X2 [Aplysia californica]
MLNPDDGVGVRMDHVDTRGLKKDDKDILLDLSHENSFADRETPHSPVVACHEEIESMTSSSTISSYADDQMVSLSADLSPAACPPDLVSSLSTDPGSVVCCPLPDNSVCSPPPDAALTWEPAELSMTDKEKQRREKVRQKKFLQRQNLDFKEREREKARRRMKALREDPTFRFHERQRDRERRKNARLINQAQRAQERERDRMRKSVLRAVCGRKSGEQVMLSDLCVIGHDLDGDDDSDLCAHHADDSPGSSGALNIM